MTLEEIVEAFASSQEERYTSCCQLVGRPGAWQADALLLILRACLGQQTFF